MLVVDEAQNLAPEVLEQVRLLTNLETETQKLLQIILIGQPELREVLGRVELRQLAQRITGRYHLDPLSDDESAAYVRHRLRVAGATREMFSNGALREVQRLSGGVPRLINVICDRALLGAFTEDRHLVSASVVRRAAGEVFGKSIQPRWLPWAAGSAVAALAVVSAVLHPAATAGDPRPPQPVVAMLLRRRRQRLRRRRPISTSCWRSTTARPTRTTRSTSCSRSGVSAMSRAARRSLQPGAAGGTRVPDATRLAGAAAVCSIARRSSTSSIRRARRTSSCSSALDDEQARVDLGGAQREIGIGDLSRSLVWRLRPAVGAGQPAARSRWRSERAMRA